MAKTATKKNEKTATEKRQEADAKSREKVAALRNKGKDWDEISAAVGIHSGKVQFLFMQHQVENGDVPAIKAKDEDALADKIVAAREKADEHSSWGWIAARAGIPESRVKKLAEAAGVQVKGSNIAKARAGSETKAAAKKSTGKKATSKKASGKGKRRPTRRSAAA